jgi:hypothetical protein
MISTEAFSVGDNHVSTGFAGDAGAQIRHEDMTNIRVMSNQHAMSALAQQKHGG